MGFWDYGRDDIRQWLAINLQMTKKDYTTEKNVENVIFEQLKSLDKNKNVHNQYSVGGFLSLKIDFDLYDGKVGIELKLAKELLKSSTNVERLLGQILYYSKRKYGSSIIVLIVGTKEEYNAIIKEIEDIVYSLRLTFVYKIV